MRAISLPAGEINGYLGGVSCPSVFSCEGVGYSTAADSAETLLAERYS